MPSTAATATGTKGSAVCTIRPTPSAKARIGFDGAPAGYTTARYSCCGSIAATATSTSTARKLSSTMPP
jgi:hypothetical protein